MITSITYYYYYYYYYYFKVATTYLAAQRSRYRAPVSSNIILDCQLLSAVDRWLNGTGTYRGVLGLPRESEE